MKNNKIIFIIFVLIAMALHDVENISSYSALISLIVGIFLSTSNKFYQPPKLNDYRKLVLNSSIIFFGFSLNIKEVIEIGSKGVVLSLISLVIMIFLGYTLIKLFNFDKKTGELITYGTAICGGSAISATSAVLNPTSKQIASATAAVFLLNGLALILFPFIGHTLAMTQEQFGTFAALSIHDVSSVEGAASQFGEKALQIATVLKLTRTLWIIPIVLILGQKNKQDNQKVSVPLFIGLFILASLGSSISSAVLNIDLTGISIFGKYLLNAALFMVGYSIKIKDIKELGIKGLLLAVALWTGSIIVGLILAFI